MRVINERWNELENELGLGLPLNTLSEVDIANKWRLRALNAEKLLNQPQLTIPKSIAEKADTMEFIELQRDGLGIFQQWFDYNQHEYMDVIFAYLNPLTRDLVKVVEG